MTLAWLPQSLQSSSLSKWSAEQSGLSSNLQRHDDIGPDEIDAFQRLGAPAVQRAVFSPPQQCAAQAPVVYVDNTRNRLSDAVLSCLQVRPNTVILHVYDLSEGLVQANDIAVFQLGMGGGFHVGTEVYGGEWAYGCTGVVCEPPRSAESHAYKCSVIVGCTEFDQKGVAAVLQIMVGAWSSQDYDPLGHNCCSFASEFCDRLGVGPMPPWIDRVARSINEGVKAGQDVSRLAHGFAQELPGKVQPHLQFASQMGAEFLAASRAVMHQADQHAQGLMAKMWEGMQNQQLATPALGNEGSSVMQERAIGSENQSWSLHATQHGPLPPLPELSMLLNQNQFQFQPGVTYGNGAPVQTFPSLVPSPAESQATLPAYPSFDYRNLSRSGSEVAAYTAGIQRMESFSSLSNGSNYTMSSSINGLELPNWAAQAAAPAPFAMPPSAVSFDAVQAAGAQLSARGAYDLACAGATPAPPVSNTMFPMSQTYVAPPISSTQPPLAGVSASAHSEAGNLSMTQTATHQMQVPQANASIMYPTTSAAATYAVAQGTAAAAVPQASSAASAMVASQAGAQVSNPVALTSSQMSHSSVLKPVPESFASTVAIEDSRLPSLPARTPVASTPLGPGSTGSFSAGATLPLHSSMSAPGHPGMRAISRLDSFASNISEATLPPTRPPLAGPGRQAHTVSISDRPSFSLP